MELTLEPLGVHHADELFLALQDTRLYTYIPQDPPASIDALRERCRVLADPASPPEGEIWLNWVMRLGGCPVGQLQATVEPHHASIAYSVYPEYWRRGLAKSGCEKMLEILRIDHGAAEARAWCDTRNTASWSLLESLGFERVAFHPAADEFKGGVSDEYEYRLALR